MKSNKATSAVAVHQVHHQQLTACTVCKEQESDAGPGVCPLNISTVSQEGEASKAERVGQNEVAQVPGTVGKAGW